MLLLPNLKLVFIEPPSIVLEVETNKFFLKKNINWCVSLLQAPLFNYKEQYCSTLTHCGRVTQICGFNTVKLGTSASSP